MANFGSFWWNFFSSTNSEIGRSVVSDIQKNVHKYKHQWKWMNKYFMQKMCGRKVFYEKYYVHMFKNLKKSLLSHMRWIFCLLPICK